MDVRREATYLVVAGFAAGVTVRDAVVVTCRDAT
jgi:hypothetical protein